MEVFNGIIGYAKVKEKLLYIIDIFKNQELYKNNNVYIPRGVILYGKPGTGKTSLVSATIKECDTTVFKIVCDKCENELIKEVNNVFSEAKKINKAIIFLDDLDKFSTDDDNPKIFSTIQANIDKIKDNDVIVFATVNDKFALPSSLTRAGRFDWLISVDDPSKEDAEEIIKYYLRDKSLDPNMDLNDIAKMISYLSCAKLESLLNSAALYSTYERKKYIEISDVVSAYLKGNVESSYFDLNCKDDSLFEACLHEAGHVVVSEVLKQSSVGFVYVMKVPSFSPEGVTRLCEKFENETKLGILSLAGKAACELYLNDGQCARGCASDLESCYKLLRDGFVFDGNGGFSLVHLTGRFSIPMSDNKLERIDGAINVEMERLFKIAQEILINNKEFLYKVANELLQKKYLLFSDIKRIRESCSIINY